VEGVIGPEAANNSKEGGALLPTLFFGIPGSSGMAVMLGALTCWACSRDRRWRASASIWCGC
jgi:TctA family transporter